MRGDRLQKSQSILYSRRLPLVEIPDKKERPDLYYVVDGHWNPDGHSFVAGIVFKELLSRNLLSQ